jgi:hypothetical protein
MRTFSFFPDILRMPLTLPAGGSDNYEIVGVNSGPPITVGVQLAKGQTLSVVSSDTSTVTLTPDAVPQPTTEDGTLSNGTAVPAGTPTVGSGTVQGAATPAQPNVAVSVTATVTNADGSVAETITDTVTVNPAMPKTADSIGVLFGTPKALSKLAPKP